MIKIHTLEDKAWFRLIKVIYIFSFIAILGFVLLASYFANQPYETVDNSRTKIICNYGNRRTFLASTARIYFYASDFKQGYLPNSKRIDLQKLCQITDQEMNMKLDSIYNETDNGTNLFDVDPYIESHGSWQNVIVWSVTSALAVCLIFEVVRRVFYYIVLGKTSTEE